MNKDLKNFAVEYAYKVSDDSGIYEEWVDCEDIENAVVAGGEWEKEHLVTKLCEFLDKELINEHNREPSILINHYYNKEDFINHIKELINDD